MHCCIGSRIKVGLAQSSIACSVGVDDFAVAQRAAGADVHRCIRPIRRLLPSKLGVAVGVAVLLAVLLRGREAKEAG